MELQTLDEGVFTQEEVPEGYEAIAQLDDIKSVLRHRGNKLLVHSVGRITREDGVVWAGLYRVTKEAVEGHFDVLPGKEFPEIAVQIAAIAGLCEYGWTTIKRLGATGQNWHLVPDLKVKGNGIKAGQIIVVTLDFLNIDSRSRTGKATRRVSIETRGMLYLGKAMESYATVAAEGVGIVEGDKWTSPFAKKG